MLRQDQLPTPRPTEEQCAVLKVFEGFSFARTMLVQSAGGREFVRKVAAKGPPAEVLRRQVAHLRTLSSSCPGIVPEFLKDGEDEVAYWYDLAFFEGSRPLSEFPSETQVRVGTEVARCLKTYVYRDARRAPPAFLEHFLDAEVRRRLEVYLEQPELEAAAAQLQKMLVDPKVSIFSPTFVHPTHGDLTLENILCADGGREWKLVDPGSICENTGFSDLGRLLQSFSCGYKRWGDGRELEDADLFPSTWPDDVIAEFGDAGPSAEFAFTLRSGLFYLGLSLVRMVPSQRNRFPSRGPLCLRLALRVLAVALGERPLTTSPRDCLGAASSRPQSVGVLGPAARLHSAEPQ